MVRTPLLKQFYDYMISFSDNLDAILLTIGNKYVRNIKRNTNNNNNNNIYELTMKM